MIIDQDSNGNKHGRAYPADAKYQQGYIPAAPHETCIVRIKDNPGVTQLSFREDRDRTSHTTAVRTGASGNQGGAGPETPTPTPTDPSTYSVSSAAMVIEGGSAALTITLSEAAPADGVAFTVAPGYDGDATAAADDVGSVTSPVTVPKGDTTLTIPIPTVDDAVDEDDETFTVIVATTATGWVKTGDGGDTAVVTIVDNDAAGITMTAARPLVVSEGGSATYTVVLNSRPTANVTVTAASDDMGAATVDPAFHTFSPSQWNQAKTFTVRGVADDDTNDESVVISHQVTRADAKYAEALVSSVRVAVSDTTSPGEQGSGGGQSTPAPTQEPDPPGSGNFCPSDYQHEHDGDNHWHSWSINEADGQCHHYVGHSGIGYHEH